MSEVTCLEKTSLSVVKEEAPSQATKESNGTMPAETVIRQKKKDEELSSSSLAGDEQEAFPIALPPGQNNKSLTKAFLGVVWASFGVLSYCAKSLVRSFTFANIFKVFLLLLIFPFFSGGDHNKEPTPTNVFHPPLQQHFILEPVGYTKNRKHVAVDSYPPVAPQNQPKNYDGYFSMDKKALRGLLLFQQSLFEPSLTDKSRTAIGANLSRGYWESENEFADISASHKLGRMGPDSAAAFISTTIVLDLNLDAHPTKEIPFIREATSFLIGHQREQKKSSNLEVVVLLDSEGGSVHAYGLIAEQLRRLREEPGITLTITCDLQALSGGYMVASVASPGHLFAAPFSSIGSIGVVGPGRLDLGDAFERFGIKEVHVKSGDRKPSGPLLGRVTESEVEQMQNRADRTHNAFKDYVMARRGDIITDHDYVSSGDFWLGQDAQRLGLVDKLTTSDEYLEGKAQNGNVVLKLKPYKNFGNDGVLQTLAHWLLPVTHGAEPAWVAVGQEPTSNVHKMLIHLLGLLNDATMNGTIFKQKIF